MNKHDIKALIFDMDGVIVDSEFLQFVAMQELLNNYGIKMGVEEMLKKYAGKTDEQIMKVILEENGKDNLNIDKLVDERTAIYLKLAWEKLQPVEGAIESIKLFSEHWKKLGLATSSKRTILDLVLDKFEIREYFKVLVCQDDIEKYKPDPDPYLKAVAKLGVLPSECVVIEDTVTGIKSAKSAGCIVLGISTTFSQHELSMAADRVFGTFKEINQFLLN